MIGFLSFILLVASLPVSVRGAYRAQLTRARFFVSFQASVLARVTRNRRPRARESDEDERRAHERANRPWRRMCVPRMCALLPCDSSRYIAPGTCPVQARVGTLDEPPRVPVFPDFSISRFHCHFRFDNFRRFRERRTR